MEAIVEKVIEGLGSLAIKDLEILRNFKDDLDNMKSMVSAIKAVLQDAEAKATNHQVSDWLEKLKDVLLDADDLLDDFSAEALAREVMTKNKMAKEVSIFFSKSNQVAYALKMGHKIKAIRKRLDEIFYVKNKLQLISGYHSPDESVDIKQRRQTFSFVGENEIVGREEEKKNIVSYLLETNVEDNVSIVSIVGIGGLGKTALAQLVYNDKAVQNYFELKMWVCVSEEFGIRQIAQKIIGHSTNSELEQVVQDLIMKIEGKHFLLVLDDVWNEDRELWHQLRRLLVGGAKGSMIIVTTRSEEVAKIMGTHLCIPLQGLDPDRSRKLFCQVAFDGGKEPNDAELVAIGMDIVKKCVGVPLVIRTIGSLLFSRKLDVSEWSYFKDSELSKIDTVEDKVFAMLKLSYDHLPSNLKKCFVYCSLFPKDFNIERKTIIQLWAAQGFIQSSEGRCRCVEDVGNEYFMKLLSMCLFQDVELDEDDEIWTCKMHDLIHDLARSVTKNEYLVLSQGKDKNWGDKMRHLSIELKFVSKFPISMVNREKIRTILSLTGTIEIIPSHLPALSRLYELVGGSAVSFPKCLRVLDLKCSLIDKVPKSIGKLKHLRYLDLTINSFEKLPQGITKLHNLETLKLNYCFDLKELPRDINRMVSLRHLEIDDCYKLRCMPLGLGQLTHLQTLTRFVLDNRRRSGSATISELRGLNSLRGILEIDNLQPQQNNTKEVESAKLLIEKSYLRELELYWRNEENEWEQVGYKDEIILEALEPHHTIRRLRINGFLGKRLPEWITNLTSLLTLELRECDTLLSLSELIGNLASLQELVLYDCPMLVSLPEGIRNLKSLQRLRIFNCPLLGERC